jgi:hypothetical protein
MAKESAKGGQQKARRVGRGGLVGRRQMPGLIQAQSRLDSAGLIQQA